MLLNYHEMTMEQSKDDPAKKQQFMVICTVMVSVLAYSLMTSGAFVAIAPVAGVFPGGYFCYKFASLDYAASMGLGRLIQKDLLAEFPKDVEEAKKLEEKRLIEEMTYHLYLDDPTRMGGRRQRFMTGIMAGEAGIPKMNKLQAMNRGKTKKLTEAQKEDMSAQKYFETIPYEMVDLPSVDALVLQYPFTNGFVSALMFSYRVVPALRKMAMENAEEGYSPVVISNCSVKQEMCTHYVPLVKSEDFLMGRPGTDALLASMPTEHFLDWEGFKQGGRKVFPFAKDYIDMLP